MHLVLGPRRFDLQERTVLIARVHGPADPRHGADAVWVDPTVPGGLAEAARLGLPVGADAADAADVARLADAGVAVVGVRPADHDALAAAARLGISALVHPDDVPRAAMSPERLLVDATRPVEGGVACCCLDADGPAAWGQATVALAAGVRVVRAPGAPSMRRVATVVDRLRAARREPAVR